MSYSKLILRKYIESFEYLKQVKVIKNKMIFQNFYKLKAEFYHRIELFNTALHFNRMSRCFDFHKPCRQEAKILVELGRFEEAYEIYKTLGFERSQPSYYYAVFAWKNLQVKNYNKTFHYINLYLKSNLFVDDC
jgi:hypothetical protein